MINPRSFIVCSVALALLFGITYGAGGCEVLASPTVGPVKVFVTPQTLCTYLNLQSTGAPQSQSGIWNVKPGTKVTVIAKGRIARCGDNTLTLDEVEFSANGQTNRGYVLPGYVKAGL
ncbi:MAG TPA: hypothetical protein VHT92_06920 [Candidatus Cybelea sp.]|nr:hypothetical protein [Candidatus Cybelea sp.]